MLMYYKIPAFLVVFILFSWRKIILGCVNTRFTSECFFFINYIYINVEIIKG